MKISWGWKIALLYCGFVGMIISLIVACSHQHFDLVSKDYYEQELVYQDVLDAGKNQSGLSAPASIHANESTVTIDFPYEFKGKVLSGDIRFYSPVNAKWDHAVKISTQDNSVTVSRNDLRNTRYTIKISYVVDGKNYYQESDITFHS